MLRVLCRCAPTGLPRIDTRSTSRRTGRGVATPIVSASTSSSAPSSCSHRSATTAGSTSPSNGQPHAHEIVTVDGTSARARIARTRSTASASDALPFRRLNASVAASVQLTRVEAGLREALVAALVEHEPDQLGRPRSRQPRDDLLGAGHLRDAVVADERDRLDPRHARRGEPRDELGAHGRRERLRLVLQAVARPDVADRDHAGAAAGTGTSIVSRGRIGSSATTRLVTASPDPLRGASSVWPNLK